MTGNQFMAQVAYAQGSIAQSMSKGYSAVSAINMHIESLSYIAAVKTMDVARQITLMAADLNGIRI